jgi:hypothetical protein
MNSSVLKEITFATAGTTAIGMTMLAGVMSPAEAITLFTDQTAFNAATQGLTTIDFEGLASVNDFIFVPNPPGLTQSGVNFTSPNTLFVVDPGYGPAFYDWGSGAVLSAQFGSGTIINAALPSSVTAVGSDIFSIDSYASDFVINLSTGDSFTVSSSNYPIRSFVGFTSDVDITSISFTATSGNTQIDNFTFGTRKSIATPEPTSVLGLLALGGLGIGSALRRKVK